VTPNAPKHLLDIIDTWPSQFFTRLKAKEPNLAEKWMYESNREKILGEEGQALSDVREYLRSCIEVGVRGWGNVEAGKGKWMKIVEERLKILECL
jgi:hypothetical protein